MRTLFFTLVGWFVSYFFFLSLGSVPALAGRLADDTERKILESYHAVQTALAEDDWNTADSAARDLSVDVESWLRAKGSKHPQFASFQRVLSGCEEMRKASDPKAFRKAMSPISQGVVEFLKANASLWPNWQLFFCPMHKPYGFWVQPQREKMKNPFMGLSMPNCGLKKKW